MSMIPPFYKNAVAAVGIKETNTTQWIGTGFFVSRKINSDLIQPYFVTNKHVIENTQSIVIRMIDRSTGIIKEMTASLYDNNHVPKFAVHPSLDVDIAVIKIVGPVITQNNLQFNSFDIDENAMSVSDLKNNGVDEGTLIYMLGFPMGLVNINSNQPICRLGCIARMNDAQISEEHNILLDIQNYPGNSGSPIVTRPDIAGIEGTNHLDQSVLIGIVHSYIPYEEKLMNMQTKHVVEVRSENSGIANMHPIEYVKQIVDSIV